MKVELSVSLNVYKDGTFKEQPLYRAGPWDFWDFIFVLSLPFLRKKKEKMWDIFPNSHIVSNTIMCFFPNNALLFKLLLIAIPPWNTCLHFIISVIQAVTPEVNTNIHFFVSSVSLVLISTIDYFPYVQMFAPIVWQYRSTERVCSPYSLLRFF